MFQVSIFSNVPSLETHRKNNIEFQDLLASIDIFGIKTALKSVRVQLGEGNQNIEHSSLMTAELARLVSLNADKNIVVLFFPKIFITGFQIPIIQYLISKKIKYYIFGLNEEQKNKLLVRPGRNLLTMPTAENVEFERLFPTIFNKSEKLTNINSALQNIVWSNILPATLTKKISDNFSKWFEKGFYELRQVVDQEYPLSFFVNLYTLDLIISRYHSPLNDIIKMFSGESTMNAKLASRTLAFLFFNTKTNQLSSLFHNVLTPQKADLAVTNKVDLFLSAIAYIAQQPSPNVLYGIFLNNIIGAFIKQRIQTDWQVAEKIAIRGDIDDTEFKERNTVRNFIYDCGLVHPLDDFKRKLSAEEKKMIFTFLVSILRKYGLQNSFDLPNLISDPPEFFFRSKTFKKIALFLKDNPLYWNPKSFKRVIPKIEFEYEDIESIFSYFRRNYLVDFEFFIQLNSKFEKEAADVMSADMIKTFNLHQQKKLKVVAEFNYFFTQESKLSYIEEFLTTLGKYQLGIKSLKSSTNDQGSISQIDKVPSGYNRVWQYPISQIHFDKINILPIIESHGQFIEKNVQKLVGDICGGSIYNFYEEYGKNSLHIIYERIIDEQFCSIGYSQFIEILKNRLFLSQRQIEVLGYDPSVKYPEEFIYHNDFYSLSAIDQYIDTEKYEQFNLMIQNVIKNYGNFVEEFKVKAAEDIIDEDELKSILTIADSLKKYERGCLVEFRKQNTFSMSIREILMRFLIENFDALRKRNKTVVISLNEKFYFLKYFIRDILLEYNGQLLYFYFCFKSSASDDKMSKKFLALLDELSSGELKQDFERLILLYKYVFQINKYINQLQKMAGLILIYEIVVQNYVTIKPSLHKIDELGLTEIPDSQKIIISSAEAIGKIQVSSLLKYPAEFSKCHEPMSSFNEGMNFYIKIAEEIDEIHDLLTMFNQNFSEIPGIKYAPKQLKLMRLAVKQIIDLLDKEFDQFSLLDAGRFDVLCSEVWKNYREMLKIEAVLQSNYRFMGQGLKQLELKIGQHNFERIFTFFKNGFESVKNKKKLRNYFSYHLEVSLTAKERINQKNIFFVIPIRNLKIINLECIKNIKKIKGLNALVYIDYKESMGMQDDFYSYIPPNHFIDLTR